MKRWITLTILMVTGLGALLFADRHYRAQIHQENARALTQASVTIQNRLQFAFAMRVRAVEDLQAFMLAPASLPDNETFDRYAAGVLDHYPTIHGFAYIDSNRIVRYFYPLKGNESAIGLDLMTRPAAPFVEKAIRERRTIVNDPAVNVMGSLAITPRAPLYRGDQLLGLVQGVFDVSDSLESISTGADPRFAVQLRDASGNRFWGPATFGGETRTLPVQVSDNAWALTVGWQSPLPGPTPLTLGLIWGVGGALLLSLIFIVNRTWTQTEWLRTTVSNRTAALRESEQRFRVLFEQAAVGVAQIRSDTGQFVRINQKFCDIAGYSREEMERLDFHTITHPDDLAGTLANMELLKAGKIRDFTMEKRYFRKDGPLVWVNLTVSPMWVAGAQPDYHIAVVEDITERKQAETALREQEEFFRLIAENIADFIAVLDLDGRRIYNSPSYRRLFGGAKNLLGTDSFGEIHPEDQQRVKQVFRETVQSGIGHQIEYRFMLEGGDIRHMESRGGVIRDEQGRVARVLVVSRDITERKQMEDQVRQLAFYDALTKLPNRRLLSDRLSQTMAASKRSGCYGALMFLDLDNFKLLNDTHGHEVGDLLLIEAADRLKSCVREVDTVARFGGDEFVVMISELEADKSGSTTQAGIIAEKIRAALARPYELKIQYEGKAETTVEHHCTASIGVALFVKDEASQDNILKWADMAMYQAKEAGCNLARFYDSKA